MHVVSVMNYKGGVGKTTLTANLAAEIAGNGYRVLMIDLDPQANLTFSFYSVDEWQSDVRDVRTIKRWYDGDRPGRDVALEELILTPPRVNSKVARDGRLDLISSHLGLIDIDLDMAAQLGANTLADSKRRFLQVHGCLARALQAPAFQDYDIVLIDCAPNFGLVTKTAIVASDFVLVPAKPDYLSTLGIGYLRGSVHKLVTAYNEYVGHDPETDTVGATIDPQFAGVVFTMTQIHSGKPILTQRAQIENLRETGIMPIFEATVRNSPRYFADAGHDGVPAVLVGALNDPVSVELRALTEEFVTAIASERTAA